MFDMFCPQSSAEQDILVDNWSSHCSCFSLLPTQSRSAALFHAVEIYLKKAHQRTM